MNILDALIVKSPYRFGYWVRGISVSLLCLILGGLGYMVYAFEMTEVSTPVTCYVGEQIVWEGIARGTVPQPHGPYPWRFVDAATGKPVVIGAHCEKGAYIYTSEEDSQ